MPIDGEWYNEFGSFMSITPMADAPGEIGGFYVSQVGEAIGEYPLLGWFGEAERPANSTPLGWTVLWRNEDRNAFSITCWSGQYLENIEQILVTWLLTRSADAGNEWEATVIGQDVFRREKPAVEDVERSLRSSRPVSHPMTS